MTSYIDQDNDLTREDLLEVVKKSMNKMNANTRSEFVVRLIESINNDFLYKTAIENCELIKFDLI